MLARRCACGFEELKDEQVIDHLLAVFEPPDSTGADGLVHLEMALKACSCGLSFTSGGEMDRHFLAVFTPADSAGSDGRQHEALA